jgi:hypothetical protein
MENLTRGYAMTILQKLEKLIYEGFKETDRKFQETDRKFQETDRLIKATEKQLKKTDIRLNKLVEQVSGLSDSVGLFAENMVAPAARRLLAKRGINITGTYSRAMHRRNGGTMEVDILGVGSKQVVAIEVKLRLELQDVKDFLEALPQFFGFFEEYRGRTLYAAVAGMSINHGVDRCAYKKGLFVLAQSGENIRLLNDKKFVPRKYKYPA